MKTIYPMFLLFLLAGGAFAQSLVNPSQRQNLEILQKEWRLQFRDPALDEEDPFRANEELRQEQREVKETFRRNEIRARQGLPPEVNTARLRELEEKVLQTKDSQPSTTYFYQIKVKNSGEKEIRAFVWDYVFFEPGTEKEVGRRQFSSEVRLLPGKTKNLVIRSASPPAGAVNAANAGKKLRDQYSEQIIIQSIEYADGSIWKAPDGFPK